MHHGRPQSGVPRVWKQGAINAIVVDKIICEAIEPTYVEELDDDYIGYSAQTIKTIITHLHSEWCIITTLEKKQATTTFHIQRDFTSHITKYACELDKQQKECRDKISCCACKDLRE